MSSTTKFDAAEFIDVHGVILRTSRENPVNDRFNANISLVARPTQDTRLDDKRPLVAVGYGPRCVPVMQLAEAAASVCDLLWMIDGSLAEMQEMSELLNRFGTVVDISGLTADEIADELIGQYRPDGLATYLDANMATYARVADLLGLPFHSFDTAVALTDKFQQRQVLAAAGLPMPKCFAIGPRTAGSELDSVVSEVGWPAVLKPRSAQGSRYTFFVGDRARLDALLSALGPTRPEMVLEEYIADDPNRPDAPYAAYVSVESIASAGAVSHLALTGRFPLAENFRETGFFIPAALSGGDQEAALLLASAAIEALDVHTGCLHTEIKFTPAGPRVIEVNGRVGGGVPEMLFRSAGVKLVDLTLQLALGNDIMINGPVATNQIGYRFFLQPPAVSATVAAINGIDAVSDHPGVDSITVHQGPGAVLDWKDGSRNHIVAVVGTAADHDELLEVDRLVREAVTVTYADVSHS